MVFRDLILQFTKFEGKLSENRSRDSHGKCKDESTGWCMDNVIHRLDFVSANMARTQLCVRLRKAGQLYPAPLVSTATFVHSTSNIQMT